MICFDFNVFVGFFLNITNSLLDGSEVACLLFPRWQLFCDNVALFPFWNWMHSNIFRGFFRSVFQQHVVPSASHIASLVPGRPRKPSYTYCLPSWVSTSLVECQGHPCTGCRIPFKPQMGSNPYLFKVLTNILSHYPNLVSSSYPHTGKGILLV